MGGSKVALLIPFSQVEVAHLAMADVKLPRLLIHPHIEVDFAALVCAATTTARTVCTMCWRLYKVTPRYSCGLPYVVVRNSLVH